MRPEPLAPGPDGTPVPSGVRLIRMANEPKLANLSPEAVRRAGQGKAIPSFFDLSSEDKKQPVPRLSVWVEGLTTVEQAWVLVGAAPTRRWVVLLRVEQVRATSAPAADSFPPTPPPDVHWEPATTLSEDGQRVPETRPGWDGHAGIAGLGNGNMTQRAALRWQLADGAEVRILSLEELITFAVSASGNR
jgi:hypothetical protein